MAFARFWNSLQLLQGEVIKSVAFGDGFCAFLELTSTPELYRILLRGKLYFQNWILWRHAWATALAVGRRIYNYLYKPIRLLR